MRRCLIHWVRSLAVVAFGLSFPLTPLVACHAADPATEYVILITADGLRWQEVFTGADNRLIDTEAGGVKKPDDIRSRYWRSEPHTRRETLLPFFWKTIATEGQVFGAPEANSRAVVTNGLNFSYPGYQEVLCGFPDPAVDSNDKIDNANASVLEWLHKKPGFEGKIAAFTSWDVFPYILNVRRSKLIVNAGWQPLEFARDGDALAIANRMNAGLPHIAPDARLDALTALGALEYLAIQQPRVLYISLDETDSWCHAGRYDLYLDAANHFDGYLEELWNWISSSDRYAGKTSLVITTDHGRGDTRDGWKSHGRDLPGSERIWIAVMGPDTPAMGLRQNLEVTQGQVAATVAALMGHDYTSADSRVAPALPGAMKDDDVAAK
jgi:hypothetical protein